MGRNEFSNIFGARRPLSTPRWGRCGGNTRLSNKQRDAAASHGALRNVAERLYLATIPGIRHIFADSSVILKFFLRQPPLSQRPTGGGREMRTTEQTNGRFGKPRNATARRGTPIFGNNNSLESAIFGRIPKRFANIFSARRPHFATPNWDRRGDAKIPNKQRGAAERRGALKFGYAVLGSSIFRRIRPKFSNIFPPDAPFPTPNWERRGNTKLPTETMGRRGTRRNSTGRQGAPVFG